MTHKLSLFLVVAGASLLLAPLTSSQAQRGRGGGGSRAGSFAGPRGYSGVPIRGGHNFARGGGHYYGGRGGYYGGRHGYYGGRHRYFHRGSYYYYDPFFFGGFGYPYYYGYGYGYGPGFGVGFTAPLGYYDDGYGYGYGYGPGYYDGGERVFNGRIASEVNARSRGDRRRDGNDRDYGNNNNDGDRRGRYAPGGMVSAVQGELKSRGYYRGPVDGRFGAGTAEALRQFQREKGLRVTGRLDERTLRALDFEQR